jgi:uncharacterized protein (TIGR02588 family)
MAAAQPGTPAGEREQGGPEPPPPPLEWAVAALGLLLLLASVGYLVLDAWRAEGGAPAPAVRVTAIERQAGRFLVRFSVRNESSEAAANLRVSGELRDGANVVETSETEFQFVPGRSQREGGLFFSRDPGTFQLDLAARSYQKP